MYIFIHISVMVTGCAVAFTFPAGGKGLDSAQFLLRRPVCHRSALPRMQVGWTGGDLEGGRDDARNADVRALKKLFYNAEAPGSGAGNAATNGVYFFPDVCAFKRAFIRACTCARACAKTFFLSMTTVRLIICFWVLLVIRSALTNVHEYAYVSVVRRANMRTAIACERASRSAPV